MNLTTTTRLASPNQILFVMVACIIHPNQLTSTKMSKENNGPKLFEDYLRECDELGLPKDEGTYFGAVASMLNSLATQLHEQGKRIEELEAELEKSRKLK